VEKRMFGGVGFMLDGNLLCCATSDGGLLLRVGLANAAATAALPTARPFVNGGRPLTGYYILAAEGLTDDSALTQALALALAFVETLPVKVARPQRRGIGHSSAG
jgi:TfoX/Sxy family transcriptional regulator of competence genes